MFGDLEVAAGIHNGVGNSLCWRDDDIDDLADLFLLVIENRSVENLTLDALADGDVTHLGHGDTNEVA